MAEVIFIRSDAYSSSALLADHRLSGARKWWSSSSISPSPRQMSELFDPMCRPTLPMPSTRRSQSYLASAGNPRARCGIFLPAAIWFRLMPIKRFSAWPTRLTAAQNPELKKLIEEAKPVIQKHLGQAQRIHQNFTKPKA
jgi:hypothetical protein